MGEVGGKEEGEMARQDEVHVLVKDGRHVKSNGHADNNVSGGQRKSPYISAGIFSKATFWWLNDLFWLGYKKDLEPGDLYDTLPADRSDHLKQRLQITWDAELTKTAEPSLSKCLYKTFQMELAIQGIVICLMEMLAILQPWSVGVVVSYFLGYGGVTKATAAIYAAVLVAIGFVYPMPRTWAMHGVTLMSMHMRTACSALIFNKVLRMGNKAFASTSTGAIVTLVSSDVEKFHLGMMYTNYMWIAPLQAVIILGLLYRDFGRSVFAGLALMIIIVPIQLFLGKLQGKLRHKTARWTDQRILLMSEIIAGMRVVKMYCWEKPLAALVTSARRKEMWQTWKASHIRGQSQAGYFISAKLVAFVIILAYTLSGHVITTEKIFKMVGWLELIRLNLFLFLPMTIQFGSELHASVLRIQRFLLLEEHAEHDSKEGKSVDEQQGLVLFEEVEATWTSAVASGNNKGHDPNKGQGQTIGKLNGAKDKLLDVDVFSLEDIDLRASKGELHAIIGPVGSGKSSLLMLTLGELAHTSGNRNVVGSVAYVPQEAWVFAGTVQENILFGKPMERDRYNKVIEACALLEDIESMSNGDLTLVGERGAKLSGGQKARINLARAAYRDADIYLLDDPLSAVDTRIARHLFEKCIVDFLHAKTVLLVTHQVHFLKDVSCISVFDQGKILAQGTHEELEKMFDLNTMVSKNKDMQEEPAPVIEGARLALPGWMSEASLASVGDISIATLGDEQEEEEQKPEKAEFIEERQQGEEKLSGTVGMAVYTRYFVFGLGQIFLPLLIISAFAFQAMFLLSDWWLAYWSTQNLYYYGNATMSSDRLPKSPFLHRNLGIYSGILGGMIFLNILRSFLVYAWTLLAARNLHNRMFHRLLRAPISFFEKNPVGRVLNKFSRDLGFIDGVLPYSYHDVSFFLVTALGTLVVACVVNPWVILVTVPVVALMLFLRYFAVLTTRDIKRIEAICRSPLYSHLSATVQGLHVIRAFRMQGVMEGKFHGIQDSHSAAWSLFLASYRWLGMRIEWAVAAYLTLVLVVCLALPESAIDGGLLGLSLTQILAVSSVLQYAVRQSAELENLMTTVERILQYTTLEQEAPEHTDIRPPPNWPTKGDLTLQEMSLYYAKEDPPAINQLSIHIEDKEKIGIVGRTGAGKSSLFVSLLRLTEPEGSIIIDGYDVTKIGLNDLREHVSVIPQDPVLFSGTMRRNLDPLLDYTDEQLWDALDQVELRQKVEDMPGQLYMEIAEAGSNFSVGQRQLVCLARALLRHNRILIIDEATANVDHNTDMLIQETLREQFRHCTVLTIAHRLHTIIDCDRVLVLDHGEVCQFDAPHLLLQDKQGIFYQMVRHTGRGQAKRLHRIAHNCYLRRHPEEVHEEKTSADEKNKSEDDKEDEESSSSSDESLHGEEHR